MTDSFGFDSNEEQELLLHKYPTARVEELKRRVEEENTTDPEMLKNIMTKEEVYRFVMHYERLTRHILKDMPNYCDILIDRDESFNFRFTKVP